MLMTIYFHNIYIIKKTLLQNISLLFFHNDESITIDIQKDIQKNSSSKSKRQT